MYNYTPLTNLATSMPAIVARSVIASRNSDHPVKIWQIQPWCWHLDSPETGIVIGHFLQQRRWTSADVGESAQLCLPRFHSVETVCPSALCDSNLSLNTFQRRPKTHLFGQSWTPPDGRCGVSLRFWRGDAEHKCHYFLITYLRYSKCRLMADTHVCSADACGSLSQRYQWLSNPDQSTIQRKCIFKHENCFWPTLQLVIRLQHCPNPT